MSGSQGSTAARERRTSSAERESVFIIAGEASGDWSGSLLARALRRARPELVLQGIGGRQMAAAGVDVVVDSSSWAAIGLVESLAKVPRIRPAMARVQRRLKESPPSLLVLIDAGAFNLRVARIARPLGVPMLYYFPPGSWRRKLKSTELPELVDAIATPFPWSAELLSGHRARVEWVGHPVVEATQPRTPPEEARRIYHLDPARPVVALAPGSREQEMRYVLPVVVEAAAELARRRPEVQFLMPLAPTVDRDRVTRLLARAKVTARLLSGMDTDALQLADAGVVCSGTATLEFCCLHLPMVIVYRVSVATTLQYLLLRRVLGGQRFAGMPNILADRGIVPEVLGFGCTPRAVADAVDGLLADARAQARMRADLAEAAQQLGTPGASERTAALALQLLSERRVVRVPRS